MSDQSRAGGWDVMKFVDALRPSWVICENVEEWQSWGPINDRGRPIESRKGETFNAWVAALESYNYRVEWRLLNSADYGERTARVRLFVIARKGGRRIAWPEPTHARDGGGPLFPMSKWRAAAEVVDWSLPMPLLSDRKKPLVDATMGRVMAGVEKFGGEPFYVSYYGLGDAYPLTRPLGVITTADRFGLVKPTKQGLRYRMFSVGEYLAAQGFPAGYRLTGNKRDQTKQIGNSVCPGVAKAICEAIAAA